MSESKKKYLVINKFSGIEDIVDQKNLIPISWDQLPDELSLLMTDESYVYAHFALTDDFKIKAEPVMLLYQVNDDEFSEGDFSTIETDHYILGFDSDDIPFGY